MQQPSHHGPDSKHLWVSQGRVWTMVAGGGASVIYADTVGDLGYAEELGNYAEYSGAPSTAETCKYHMAAASAVFWGLSVCKAPVLPGLKIEREGLHLRLGVA